MTTTVLELIANLKHYPDGTVVNITDVDDQEFAIVDFEAENSTLKIIISKPPGEEEFEGDPEDEE